MTTAAASFRTIELARIDASNRLRPINPAYVQALVDEAKTGARWTPIRVVERGEDFRLVFGGHRCAAAGDLGWIEIEAEVFPAAAYPDDAAARLDEIRENMLRYELTALDRAVHLAAWKELYEAVNETAPRGRRKASEKSSANLTNNFAKRFSEAAAAFLDVSESSIQRSVAIAAGISAAVRNRIAFKPIADTASELILLARQDEARQNAILGLLFADPPAAHSVAEAIAVLDRVPRVKLEGWRKLSNVFAKMKPAEQRAFVEAHADEFRGLLAEIEATSPRKAA